MADFFAYQPIDIFNEEHLGDSTSSSDIISQSGWENMDKNGYQTVAQQLSSGFTKVSKYHSPGRDSANLYKYSQELRGRYSLDNFKIYYNDWISIYGGRSSYSDITPLRYGDSANNERILPGTETEIFAKILSGNDNISGSRGADYLYAFRGDDLVNPGGGDDYVNGGSGIDTVRLSGRRTEYALSKAADYSGIHHVIDFSKGVPTPVYFATIDQSFKASGRDGNDILVNVEKIKFDDGIYDIVSGSFAEENNIGSSSKPIKPVRKYTAKHKKTKG